MKAVNERGVADNLLALSFAGGCALSGPEWPRQLPLSFIGDGDTRSVIEGGKADQRCAWACIDAPEAWARLPYGRTGRNYLAEPVEDRQQGGTPSSRGSPMAAPWPKVEVGEVNLNLAMVEDGMAFAYLKYSPMRRERPISMPTSGPAGAAMAVAGAWRITPGTWTFRRQHAQIIAICC